MAFPTVLSITETLFGSDATQHLVDMPATVVADDLLLIFFVNDGPATQTTPGGWTELFDAEYSDSAVRFACYAKVAVGDEDGTTVDVVTSAAQEAAAQVYRINAWFGALAGVEDETPTTGYNTAPDCPELTPTWGAEDTLWIACYGADHNDTVDTYPTNYANGTYSVSSGGSGAGSMASARRELNATDDNPVAYDKSGSEQWVANTVAIRPAGAGGGGVAAVFHSYNMRRRNG